MVLLNRVIISYLFASRLVSRLTQRGLYLFFFSLVSSGHLGLFKI
jgi:hypothetical protein